MEDHENVHLLDIVALAALLLALTDPTATTLLTPSATPAVNADGVRWVRSGLQGRHRFSAMDGDHMAREVVLAAERPAA